MRVLSEALVSVTLPPSKILIWVFWLPLRFRRIDATSNDCAEAWFTRISTMTPLISAYPIFRSFMSILRRLHRAVDHQHFHWRLLRLQPESQLLAKRGK